MTKVSSPHHVAFIKGCFNGGVTTGTTPVNNHPIKTETIMKLNKIILNTAVAALAAGFVSQSFAADEKEVKITLDKVPAAVQQAVKAYASETEIKGIEDSDVDGTKVIEFDIEKNGQASEIAFRPDGRLFSTEGEVPFAELPAAVQQTITKKSADAKAGAPEKVVQEGKTTYEVVIEKNGKKIEYTISPEGKIVGKEEAGKD